MQTGTGGKRLNVFQKGALKVSKQRPERYAMIKAYFARVKA